MPFVKGRSGNPSGRPKTDKSLQDLARSHAPEAVRTLALVMKSDTSPAAARVTAAVSILDRAYGKPAQAVTMSGAVGTYDAAKLSELTDEELTLFETLLARIAAGASASSGDPGGDREAGG